MSTIIITYDAKCKDCHFHQRSSEGKRTVTKCLNLYPKVRDGKWVRWTRDQINEAPKTTLKSKACKSFILFGTFEDRVKEILKERKDGIR